MVLYDSRGEYLVGGELALLTRKRRQIPNDQKLQEETPAHFEAAKSIALRHHPTARVRSLSSLYNCVGMVFASRRTEIHAQYVRMILEDDGYQQVERSEVHLGDVVVYTDEPGDVSHVGVVAELRSEARTGDVEITVMSQWGHDGEYVHREDDVNQYLGAPAEYWTDRR